MKMQRYKLYLDKKNGKPNYVDVFQSKKFKDPNEDRRNQIRLLITERDEPQLE